MRDSAVIKLSTLCYFRKVRRRERLRLIRQFQEESAASSETEKKEFYRKYKRKLADEYELDFFKPVMLLLQLISIVLLVLALPAYLAGDMENTIRFTIRAVPICLLTLVLLGLGILLRGITLTEYKFNLILVPIQLAGCAVDYYCIMSVFGAIAVMLKPF